MCRTSAFWFGLFCITRASDILASTKPVIIFDLDEYATSLIEKHAAVINCDTNARIF